MNLVRHTATAALVIILGLGMAHALSAQPAPPSQNRPDMPRQVLDLAAELELALSQEPTQAHNVYQRHQQLSQALKELMASGRGALVDHVLTRDGEMAIRDELKRPDLAAAAALVQDAIGRLSSALAAEGGDRPAGMRQPAGMQPAAALPPSPPLRTLKVNDWRAGPGLESVLKLANPAIDQARRRLYITGFASTQLGVVDLDSRRLLRTVDIGVTGGFLVVDPVGGQLYLFQLGQDRFFALDPEQGGSRPISGLPAPLRLPPKDAWNPFGGRFFRGHGFPFQVGFLPNRNASYNVIQVVDSQGRQLGEDILHGPDALYFDIDQSTGHLYGSNTGDASLSVFDLTDRDRKLGDIPVGASVEGLLWDDQAQALFIRNRLGGSQIYRWDPATDQMTVVGNENQLGQGGIGMWPTGMAAHGGRVYVLSHYGGRVDVLDSRSGALAQSLDLGLVPRPRTDAISEMVLDQRSRRLYAAFPELGLVTALDLDRGRRLGVIKIDLPGGHIGGPFHLLLGVSETKNKLYVYLAEQRRLNLYDARSLGLEQSVDMDAGPRQRLAMTLDDKHGLLYLGRRILDSATLAPRGVLGPDERVVHVDPEAGRLYVAKTRTISPSQVQEELLQYQGGQVTKRWTFSPTPRLPLCYAFDRRGGRFFVGYFETAVVEEHPL